MKTLTALFLGLFLGAVRGAELSAPTLQLDKNPLTIRIDARQTATLCTARLVFPTNDGYTDTSIESYLLRWDNGFPVIVDMIDGFAVELKLRDVDGDGKPELLAFFSAGAHQYGVHLYKIDGDKITPLLDQPVTSNMHSIKFERDEVHVETVYPAGEHQTLVTTHRYRIDGRRMKLLGISKKNSPE